MDKKTIKISVRGLVEFILREGNIDKKKSGGGDKDAMLLGGKLHRKIQRKMGPEYEAEVSLSWCKEYDTFTLSVEGRADGIISEPDSFVVDEIKSVFCDIDLIKEPTSLHMAQAKSYAYFYCLREDLDEMTVQMTYCQIETEEIKRFRFLFTRDELEEWFMEVIRKYEKWAKFQVEWEKKRRNSIRSLEFPFEYREGQKAVATSVYTSIFRSRNLFIQAPTGVGKTMATIFPTVKAMGEGLVERIFYLTAKTITRVVASQAFSLLRAQGLSFKVITLTAKEKICFQEVANCTPETCPYAKGHYDRVNDAVYHLWTTEDVCSKELIEQVAEEYQVCPFEMALDLSLWVDSIICDYNYVFDPVAKLKRFFQEGRKADNIFLIDEAHNLVERAREMYSATLIKEEFLETKKILKAEAPRLAKRLETVNKSLLAMKKNCETYERICDLGNLPLQVLNTMVEFERFLEESSREDLKEQVLEFYFKLRSFLYVVERLDENYVMYMEHTEISQFKLKLFCVNPSRNLKECLDYGRGGVFFSATLLPINYYKRLLSTEEDEYAIYAQSPFDVKRRLLLVGQDVSTKYTRRGKDMYIRLATYIQRVMDARNGNYLVFFPSYKMLRDVLEIYTDLIEEGTEVVVQDSYMTEEHREAFLEQFETPREGCLVGFCVMGGIFSEGIDLEKDRLIGAIIVGTGLPMVCTERELLREYFEEIGLAGFDYSYLYPGLNKVMQSAGRVIRTEEDAGVLLLLDDRFLGRQYIDVFPKEWANKKSCTLEDVQEHIEVFWKELK